MNIYYTLCTNGSKFSHTTLNMWKLSLALLKNNYPNDTISLVCDDSGRDILQNLPFDNFHVVLNNVNYPSIWSLGKIYAYNFICSLGEPFLHLDADVFLWDKLPIQLIDSPVFCQSEDRVIGSTVYDIDKLHYYTSLAIPIEWMSNRDVMAYNLGIFGGTNITFIQNYCNYVLSMINNPIYQSLWTSNPVIPLSENFNLSSNKACLVEQGNFGIFCKANNVQPAVLFINEDDSVEKSYKKYTHLIIRKGEKEILDRVDARVASEPYDLIPRDISKDEWNWPIYHE